MTALALLAAAGIFLECENFERLGGWTVETQSMRQLGSSYVMAHGYGRSVEDAVTTVKAPETGEYTVWARTRNWNAEWTKGAAGKFFVSVASKEKAGGKWNLIRPPAAIEAMLPIVDMWLPDFKADDDALHQKYTGASNKIIKRNLETLVKNKAKLEVRMLVVPGCTDGDDLKARHAYLDSLGIPKESRVELEYHDYARSKYQALGMPDTMPKKI